MVIQPEAPTFVPGVTQLDLLRFSAMAAKWEAPPDRVFFNLSPVGLTADIFLRFPPGGWGSSRGEESEPASQPGLFLRQRAPHPLWGEGVQPSI